MKESKRTKVFDFWFERKVYLEQNATKSQNMYFTGNDKGRSSTFFFSN